MIWIAAALAYIGIGGLVAVWVDHQNQHEEPFDQLNPLFCGAAWLPLAFAGLYALAINKASGAAKRRR